MAIFSLCWILLSHTFVCSSSFYEETITPQPGQNATLTCQASKNKNIIAVEWSRVDLGKEYVLLYRDENFDPQNQYKTFVNRVYLQDRQMKDGNVTLILENVTAADNGTYECRVVQAQINRRKRANLKTYPISIIHLSVVDPPGQTGGHTANGGKEDKGKKDEPTRKKALPVSVLVSLSCFGMVLVVITALVRFQKYKKNNTSFYPTDKEAEELDCKKSPNKVYVPAAENTKFPVESQTSHTGSHKPVFSFVPVPSPDKWRGGY
uniref:uncharacterized protein LOC101487941 n=1 Tax=Maylandia zebra TaxID=106582 RepID=UPI00032A1027|nr:uncharacterized protein LOC101487941 [Maylandia zebra]